MKCLLAIDQSTSATKALLFNLQGALIDSASLPHEQHHPQLGWVEHDAEEIWINLLQVVRQVCDRNVDYVRELQGVCLTNQRETIVVFDRRTERPLAPAIVWQCRRTDAICQELRGAGHEEHVHAKTGLKLDAYFSASKLTWLVRQHPEIASGFRDGEALIGTIDAYLIYRLTKRDVFATDTTNASRTLLFDITQLRWDEGLCELFEVPPTALPEVRESFAHFGNTDCGGILPRSVPICGVMGDSQASLFAQRCYELGDTKATFGTGTSVMVNIGDRLQMPENGAVASLAWVLEGQPTYVWEGLINYSAATIAWLKEQLGLISSIDESETLAASVKDCGGVYLVPAFGGMGAPYWRPSARAAIIGMTACTNRSHIARAALESIAYQVSDVLDLLQSSGVSPVSLAADGGATRNCLLMQMVADITQIEVNASDISNSSSLGAAMAGMLGLGIVGSLKQLSDLKRSSTIYPPLMNSDDANLLKAGWTTAVQRVL